MLNALISRGLSDNNVSESAIWIFSFVKTYAIFLKHRGFSEEKEWRVAYLREIDLENRLSKMIGYQVNSHGVDLKFKLKVPPFPEDQVEDVPLGDLIDRIIIGPSLSDELTLEGIKHMLKKHAEEGLIPKLRVSSIPYRPKTQHL